MTVNDILEKIEKIDRLYCAYTKQNFNNSDSDEAMDLLMEYKEELLSKKIAK